MPTCVLRRSRQCCEIDFSMSMQCAWSLAALVLETLHSVQQHAILISSLFCRSNTSMRRAWCRSSCSRRLIQSILIGRSSLLPKSRASACTWWTWARSLLRYQDKYCSLLRARAFVSLYSVVSVCVRSNRIQMPFVYIVIQLVADLLLPCK